MEGSLAKAGLYYDAESRSRAAGVLVVLGVLVFAVGLIKVIVALGRGHHNIGFLFLMMILSIVVLGIMSNRKKTPAGQAFISQAEGYYSRLRNRTIYLDPGGATNEAALAAAVFGIGVLPAIQFPFVGNLNGSLEKGSQTRCVWFVWWMLWRRMQRAAHQADAVVAAAAAEAAAGVAAAADSNFKPGGGKGVRTPDLLHAMQARKYLLDSK